MLQQRRARLRHVAGLPRDEKTRLAGGLSFVGRADGFAGPAQQGLNAAQTRAAFSAALSVGLGRITALHFSESAL